MSENETHDDEAADAADVEQATEDSDQGSSEDAAASNASESAAAEAPAAVRGLRRFNQALSTTELGLLIAVLALLVVVGSFAALFELLGKAPGLWPKELVKYSVFFIAMFGAALASSRQQLIAMDIVGRFAPARARAWIRAVTNLFASVISVVLLVRAVDVSKVEMKSNVPYEIISPGIGSWILPVGLGLIATHLALHVLVDLSYLLRGRVAPEADGIKVH